MKKRLMSIVVAAILVVTLAGCAGKTSGKEEEKTQTTQVQESQSEKTDAIEPAEDAEAAPDKAESKADGVSDITDRSTGEKLPTHNGAVMLYTNTEIEIENEYLLYCMNLRTEMIRFGYDDSDDESEITDNVHKTMQSATGVEYLTDFLKSRTDFMQIADLAGIDPEELAEGYASHFEVKVTDIQFDDETHATAYCTVTSPDFVRMYENLDSIAEDKMANIDKDNLTEEEFYKIYGDMLTEYTTDKFFPHMTHDMEISYVYDDGFEIWTPEDKEAVVNEMRIALMNF